MGKAEGEGVATRKRHADPRIWPASASIHSLLPRGVNLILGLPIRGFPLLGENTGAASLAALTKHTHLPRRFTTSPPSCSLSVSRSFLPEVLHRLGPPSDCSVPFVLILLRLRGLPWPPHTVCVFCHFSGSILVFLLSSQSYDF